MPLITTNGWYKPSKMDGLLLLYPHELYISNQKIIGIMTKEFLKPPVTMCHSRQPQESIGHSGWQDMDLWINPVTIALNKLDHIIYPIYFLL